MGISSITKKNLNQSVTSVPNRLFGLGLLTVLLFVSTTAAQSTIGRVYNFKGTWYREGQARPLTHGDTVGAGSVIRIQSPSQLDFIVILLTNGQHLEKRCGRRECEQPFQLPPYVAQQRHFWYIIEPVLRIFQRQPVRYSVPMPKSGAVKLREAVVEVKNGTANIAEVFQEVPKGSYTIKLTRKSQPGIASRGTHSKPITIWWEPLAQPSVSVSGVKPGIYEVRQLHEQTNKQYLPTPVTAWVLITEPNSFEETTSSFRNAIYMTDAWTGLGEDSVRAFLRAYLDHLLVLRQKDE